MNNNMTKALLIAFVIIYILSPIDAFPGPIDDFIVTLMGYAAQRRIGSAE